METFEAAVESLSEAEHLQLRKVCKETYFIQVFAFTAGCNWLDIVEVHFSPGQGWTVRNILYTHVSMREISDVMMISVEFVWWPNGKAKDVCRENNQHRNYYVVECLHINPPFFLTLHCIYTVHQW